MNGMAMSQQKIKEDEFINCDNHENSRALINTYNGEFLCFKCANTWLFSVSAQKEFKPEEQERWRDQVASI